MNLTEQEQLDMMRLTRSGRVGPATYRVLMAEHGTAEAAIKALPDVAKSAGVRDYAPCSVQRAEDEYRLGLSRGYKPLFVNTKGYPELLAETKDAPPMLWCQGNLDLLEKPCIAIVGSRKVTDRALEKAYELGSQLGEMGYLIVSGLARGVDTEAHKGSLETGTVAVVASGFDYTYPKENTELFESIIQKGLAISEQPIDTQPQARHFPQRNRIVAGLSIATVCVEAGNRSGSGITLICARDIGRKTMAITPLEDLPSTEGYKFFLENGATPVVSAQDIHNALQEDAK